MKLRRGRPFRGRGNGAIFLYLRRLDLAEGSVKNIVNLLDSYKDSKLIVLVEKLNVAVHRI